MLPRARGIGGGGTRRLGRAVCGIDDIESGSSPGGCSKRALAPIAESDHAVLRGCEIGCGEVGVAPDHSPPGDAHLGGTALFAGTRASPGGITAFQAAYPVTENRPAHFATIGHVPGCLSRLEIARSTLWHCSCRCSLSAATSCRSFNNHWITNIGSNLFCCIYIGNTAI